MTSKLGLHWLREHPNDRVDFAHIERMQYRSVKPFKPLWDNRDACANLLAALPRDSYILARDHGLSEQKQDMENNPVGTGERHANEWAEKVRNGVYKLPADRTFFLGINEPNADSGDRAVIDRYTTSFLDRLSEHGLRGGAFNFSTGHPRTVDGTPNTLADYTVFERSHHAIVEGHHIGVLHIYGTGAVPCAPGHYDRLRACAWQDVEWVVGEFAVDEHVIGGGEHHGFHKYFEGRLNDYCVWLDAAIMGVNDPRIHSYQVFTYDYSHPWSGFDVSVIRDALESYPWRHMQQVPGPLPQPPTVETHLPTVGTGPTPPPATVRYVSVPAGANIRERPITGNVLVAVPFREAVSVVVTDAVSGWHHVEWQGHRGYMAPMLLSVNRPEVEDDEPIEGPTQPPVPSDDKWQRCIAFVLKQEGGLSNDPNDPGNYVNGVFVGTKYGISAAAHPGVDIVNLSIEQAKNIYFQSYWIPSGASVMPFPLCLAAMDLAVNGGIGRAKEALNESGYDFVRFMAWRIAWYSRLPQFNQYGVAWIRRCSELMLEASRQ